ncbi:mitochondrial ornithine transporter 1-like isoform X2 [Ranitomeya variabilis]|uniref:mitochondrial ornithine transporter 1-like isoform X2 n=1 Tax=Ranitomeya variabilis TaxID=490064 RepID=UPI00405799BC
MSPDQSHPSHLIQVLINSTSGAMGGVACVFSGQPFDTVKVKMQAFPSLYRGFVDCAVRTYHTEGLRGLYQGTVPALLANVSENAVLFACYGFCQNLVCHLLGMQDPSQLRDYHKATAGSLASVVSSLVLCPTELVKCRMQTLHEMRISGHKAVPAKSTSYSIVSDIVKTEGVCGLFRGLSSTWLREIPGCASGHCEWRCRWGFFLAVCISSGFCEVKNSGFILGIWKFPYLLPAYLEDRRTPHSIQWTNAHHHQVIPLQRCSFLGL